MSDAAALTADLIRIDSVNPALAQAGAGEERIADYVSRWGAAHGLSVRRLGTVPGRPSVVLRAPGRGGGRTLMLNAHLDTVGTDGMADPFEPRVRAGRMYGRGSLDMKGSLAACLLTAVQSAHEGLRGDVVVTAVADEEHGSLGTEAAVAEISADGAVVTEPTDLELQVAHRGFSVLEVGFRGVASHTSKPDEGVNALAHLGRFLTAVEASDRLLRSRPPHPLLAHGSWQAVLASGGRELFTTPAWAAATIERRTLPGEDARAVEEEVVTLLAGLRANDRTVDGSVRTLVAREPFEAVDGSELEGELRKAIHTVLGKRPTRRGAPFWTDAALVAGVGIPTILFGPSGGGIHTPDEWVDLASVECVRRVLCELARTFCG